MEATEFVASYIDAWNELDSLAVANHLAKNGTYLDMPVHQHLSGPQLIDYLDETFELEAYFYEQIGEVLSAKRTIAFQYKALPRDSKTGDVNSEPWFGAEFVTMGSGTASEIADYYEPRGLEIPHGSLTGGGRATRVQRYAKSGLSTVQMETVKTRLCSLMETDKAFLQPDLTLPDLARSLDCSVNHVSQAINAGFGMSFFDYLNQYRIREAMLLLSPEDSAQQTVLNVALQVGFNSTSTFYVAFKKVTGKTPSEFRRSGTA
jgi:AraC-like DNA-binding protein